MFNNHSMSLVLDLGVLGQSLYNRDFLRVAAITSGSYPDLDNIYYAGVLMPPTEMLMDWADGNQQTLNVQYPQYLMTKDCDDFIIALIAAMTKMNIVLYIPDEEFSIFGQLLLNHIYYTYGIVVNTPSTQFAVLEQKIPLIISKFFMIDVMDPDVYLSLYPANYMLPDFVINKLAEELNPFNGQPATFEQYREYFNKLNASKIAQQPKVQLMEVKKE